MKLSEKALTYLVEENDFSLQYYIANKYKCLQEDYDGAEISLAIYKKKIELHKEIESFLEEVGIKENEK